MSRRCGQLRVRDPDPLLLLPLLARAHRHTAILRRDCVDTSDVFAYEPRLAPRAAKDLFWIIGFDCFFQTVWKGGCDHGSFVEWLAAQFLPYVRVNIQLLFVQPAILSDVI